MSQFTDQFVDSEDLMSWFLLNPEIDAFTAGTFGFSLGTPSEQPPQVYDTHLTSAFDPLSTINDGTNSSPPFNNHPDHYMHPSSLPSQHTNARIKKESNAKREASPSAGENLRKAGKIARKRPRDSLDDLEERVKALRAENADLQAHLLNVTQRTTEVQKQRVSMERLMASKLSEIEKRKDADQSELAEIVKQYTDLYSDYGKCRQREVAFHLQQLEKLIVPTQTTKMCLWTLHQEKSSPEANKSPMFSILAKELEITPEQTDKILERRGKISSLLTQLQESLDLLQALKIHIEKKHACYDQICGRVQSAATPQQVVRFLIWITNNAEALGKYLQGFNRNVHHVPNVELVNKFTSECSVQPPSSSSNAHSLDL